MPWTRGGPMQLKRLLMKPLEDSQTMKEGDQSSDWDPSGCLTVSQNGKIEVSAAEWDFVTIPGFEMSPQMCTRMLSSTCPRFLEPLQGNSCNAGKSLPLSPQPCQATVPARSPSAPFPRASLGEVWDPV